MSHLGYTASSQLATHNYSWQDLLPKVSLRLTATKLAKHSNAFNDFRNGYNFSTSTIFDFFMMPLIYKKICQCYIEMIMAAGRVFNATCGLYVSTLKVI